MSTIEDVNIMDTFKNVFGYMALPENREHKTIKYK